MRVDDAPERRVGELRVDRHDAAADEDRRVDDLAVLEPVLHRVLPGRQHVLEQALEQQFAELAAWLRGPQHLLQAGDVAPDLEHLLRRVRELPELLVDGAHRLLRRRDRRRERLVDAVDARRQAGVERAHLRLHLLLHRVELLLVVLLRLLLGLRLQLRARRQRGELLLQLRRPTPAPGVRRLHGGDDGDGGDRHGDDGDGDEHGSLRRSATSAEA